MLSLRKAIRSYKMELQEKPQTEGEETVTTQQGSGIVPMTLSEVRTLVPQECIPALGSNTFSGNSGSSFLVHNHGIPMPTDTIFSFDADMEARILSSISVFNLGLCFHLSAIKSRTARDLQRAKSLYLKAISLIRQLIFDCCESRDTTGTGNALVDLLVMALMNNLALVQMESRNFASAREIVQRLMSFLQGSALSDHKSEQTQHRAFLSKASSILGILKPTIVTASAA